VLPDVKTTVPLLGTEISRWGMDEALQQCRVRVERAGGYACFVNVHLLVEGREDPHVAQALKASTFSFADGVPLLWAARRRGKSIASRVCGPDFMDAFLRQQATVPHGFIGGTPGVAEKIAERYGLKFVSYCPPMRDFSRENAFEDWRKFVDRAPTAPKIVWVGLGAPKQERWMEVVSSIAPDTLFFGVGAAFDFLAGSKKRAPIWMQRLGLEWLYRFLREPRRLWKRYVRTNALFLRYLLLAPGSEDE
jgi:N-acetylglucosaminyldiphosphoundecaprenol N-acetyl-beta-D-mannosaminyltransferase